MKILNRILNASVLTIGVVACEKSVPGPGPHPVQPCKWRTEFILVDSSNNQLFYNYSEVPFDYNEAFYINALGDTNSIYSKKDNSNGIIFSLAELCDDLRREMELTNNITHEWMLYPDPSSDPYTFTANIFTKGEYFETLNGDTVNNTYSGKDIIQIRYK